MAKNGCKHLSPAAVAALELDDDARIAYINTPRWISYTLAQTTLKRLEDVLVLPPSRRMRNLLLVGESNNGKTMLLERFADRHKPKDNPGGDYIVAPVVMVESPPVPDEARLYSNILEYLFAPFKYNDRVDKKESQVLRLLHEVQCRMLILDDINNLLAGNIGRQQAFLNVLRTLGNALKIPIVTAGTLDALPAAIAEFRAAATAEAAVETDRAQPRGHAAEQERRSSRRPGGITDEVRGGSGEERL